MPTNPLKLRRSETDVPEDRDDRKRFWIERGNRILWGEEPTSKGDFLEPQRRLHWVCSKDGHYSIESR